MNRLGKTREIPLGQVRVRGGFWESRQRVVTRNSLPAQLQQLKDTGRLYTFRLPYKPGEDTGVVFDSDVQAESVRPHHYWDSDVAKWIEAASYSLQQAPDPEMEALIDSLVEEMEAAQWEDGYLNSYFTQVAPGERFTNVYVMHELYCAGHMLEAAVAYYLARGKRKYLDIMLRYVDMIERTFGPEEGKIHGYPGHQEIELALVRLYRVTGDERHLKLSKYFIDQRGRQPHFFEQETLARGADPAHSEIKPMLDRDHLAAGPYALFQAHLPVREQKTAEGHAVRVMYQCCAMADLADETGDPTLLDACKTLWDNVTLRRMYITGGVSPKDIDERFAYDYHLPNEFAYNETCATIGLVMWARRMLRLEPHRRYGDVMEQALYNGVLSGMSLEGDHFFYANHLANSMGLYENRIQRNERMFPWRQQWFPVSCCPPNIARLIGSIGEYVYGADDEGLYVHLYIQSEADVVLGGAPTSIALTTDYPWQDTVSLTVSPQRPARFALRLRQPAWCERAEVAVNGQAVSPELVDGYLVIRREWRPGDSVTLRLPMQVRLMAAHPSVRMDCGKAAITHGPLVYCLEEVDNGPVFDIAISPTASLTVSFDPGLCGGVNVITGTGRRRDAARWEDALYRPLEDDYREIPIRAVPYFAWSNRKVGDMAVWVNLYGGR